MKQLITLLLVLCLVPAASAQEVQKCCGTQSSTFLLGSTNYARHSQCLYAPGDFTGATAGSIIRLYYRYGVSGIEEGNTLGDMHISLVQTGATAFANETFLTGLQSVFDATSFSIAPGLSGDWFSIDLDTPFLYDPAQSLVVDIRFETSANTAFGTMSVGSTSGRKIMADNTSSPTGETWTTLQDIGFDLDQGSGMVQRLIPGIRLFPNPATNRSELILPQPLQDKSTLDLYDLTGRTVHTQVLAAGSSRAAVDLEALPAGIYMLQLRDATGVLNTLRLVRQ